MNNSSPHLRFSVVQYYLANDISFRKAARKFHVGYRTIYRWVKLYKEHGEEGLGAMYRRPWNRTRGELEEKLVLMKENDPVLTVRQARANLEKRGVRISIKGIWAVWKRYGYAGFSQENMPTDLTDCSWTKESTVKFAHAKRAFDLGETERTAEVLNSIPALPRNELILKIPDPMLSTRRRVEKMGALFGKIPVHVYLERSRMLYEECRNQNLNYLALMAGLVETMALSWHGGPSKMIEKTEELKRVLAINGEHLSYSLFAPRFSLLISEGIANAKLMKIREASNIARACRKVLKRKRNIAPRFMRDVGQLYAQLGDFREAEYWYLRSLNRLGEDGEKLTKSLLADILVAKGEYAEALRIRKAEQLNYWGSLPERLRVQSAWALVRGMPHEAISLATEALASLKQEGVRLNMFGCYFTLASAYCGLGERTKARQMLSGILPFFVKNRLEDVRSIIEILLCQVPSIGRMTRSCEPPLPNITVALLLHNGQYAKALRYAERKGTLSFFHRCVLFFPDLITDLLEKGEPTGLPRTMLNLPVFRKEIPVYSVKFLGDLVVYRNQRHLDVKLKPKETAFLIHLARSKGKCIALDRIHKNFWPRSENPARNRTLLLATLRKTLNLPSHLLHVRYETLHSECYFMTDYDEYLEHLAQAKALRRAGEWDFARGAYLTAFSLFRGAPFEKMYDDWSGDMRYKILGQLEKDVKEAAEACFEHDDRAHGIEILQKAADIIPDSDEIKNLAEKLTNT
ncbi:transposase [candidate division WOR-3 bacterium]|nr:transposase [candidate division WOR-3 bacterium]